MRTDPIRSISEAHNLLRINRKNLRVMDEMQEQGERVSAMYREWIEQRVAESLAYLKAHGRDVPDLQAVVQRKACGDKVRHATRDSARQALKRMLSDQTVDAANRIRPYLCPFGDHWHLGHKPNAKNQRLKSKKAAA